MSKNETDRRDFLKKSSKALVILPLADATNRASANDADEVNSKFQPEEFWKERMESPDDGKKYGWFVDTRRCFGCHGCEVSCKAETMCHLEISFARHFTRTLASIRKSHVCFCRWRVSTVKTHRASKRALAEHCTKNPEARSPSTTTSAVGMGPALMFVPMAPSISIRSPSKPLSATTATTARKMGWSQRVCRPVPRKLFTLAT